MSSDDVSHYTFEIGHTYSVQEFDFPPLKVRLEGVEVFPCHEYLDAETMGMKKTVGVFLKFIVLETEPRPAMNKLPEKTIDYIKTCQHIRPGVFVRIEHLCFKPNGNWKYLGELTKS